MPQKGGQYGKEGCQSLTGYPDCRFRGSWCVPRAGGLEETQGRVRAKVTRGAIACTTMLFSTSAVKPDFSFHASPHCSPCNAQTVRLTSNDLIYITLQRCVHAEDSLESNQEEHPSSGTAQPPPAEEVTISPLTCHVIMHSVKGVRPGRLASLRSAAQTMLG